MEKQNNYNKARNLVIKMFPGISHEFDYYSIRPTFSKVIKHAYDPSIKIFYIKNHKGQIKFSSNDKFGEVIIDDKEIKNLVNNELSKEKIVLENLVYEINMLLKDKLTKV